MSDLIKIVQNYYAAFSEKDFLKMKSFLHRDYYFKDPIDQASSADEYIEKIKVMSSLEYESKILKNLQMDNEIAVYFEWHLYAPIEKVISMSEWFVFENNKIKNSELFFNPLEFDDVMKYLHVPV